MEDFETHLPNLQLEVAALINFASLRKHPDLYTTTLPQIRQWVMAHQAECHDMLAEARRLLGTDGLAQELQRVTNLLETWATDHAADRTAEIDSAIHCAHKALDDYRKLLA
jgi:hypothetical protein